jgi:ubiquinone/menaquinone biosynthesis C-methylase UbiE
MAFLSPKEIVAGLRVTPGQKVVDFGCGSGAYIEALELALTASGTVYAVDINKQLLEKIQSDAKSYTGAKIHSLWVDIAHEFVLPIEAQSIDMVVFSNILSLIENRSHMCKEANRIMKDNGKILVVDWHQEGNIVDPTHSITAQDAEDMCREMGFAHITELPAGDHHFAFIAQK